MKNKIIGMRWWIISLVALATAINYLDRQNLPVAIGEIQKVIAISDTQYGLINSLFLLAYGTMYAVGGKIVDSIGVRAAYAIMIVWWSAANIVHGLVSTVLGLGVARFLLGVGEGGSFPGSAKVVAEWFPEEERSFAFGIFNTGSSIGAVIAPPVIAAIILVLDWRWAFILTGLVGFVWAAIWLLVYRRPRENSHVTEQELQRIESGQTAVSSDTTIKWLHLFRFRQVWGLLIMKFLTDAAWFFFIFWLPKYLNDVRELDIASIGAYAWIPYAFAAAGSFLGGWFSSKLISVGMSTNAARKIPLALSASLLPLSLLIASAPLSAAILFFGLAMFGHQLWSTIVQTLAADFFPASTVGAVAGLMGCVGTYGAMLFSFGIGIVIETSGYQLAFLIAGILHPMSFVLFLLIAGPVRPVIGEAKHSI